MNKIPVDIEVYQQAHGEFTIDVPIKIIEQGDKAIRDYLWRKNGVENALDYGSKNTELNYLVRDNG